MNPNISEMKLWMFITIFLLQKQDFFIQKETAC